MLLAALGGGYNGLGSEWRFATHWRCLVQLNPVAGGEVVLLVEVLGQEVDLGESDDQCAYDAEQQTEPKVEATDNKLDANEAERKTCGHGEEELQHGNQMAIDLFHYLIGVVDT